MEVKCRVCGGETNQKDFCRPCELFRKDEVEALRKIDNTKGTGLKKAAAVGRSNEANLADECPITNTMPAGPRVISLPKNKNNGGVEMRKNKRCGKCNTEATSNREKECRKCGEPFVKKATVRSEKKKRGRPSKAVIPAAPGIFQKAAAENTQKIKSAIVKHLQIHLEVEKSYTVTVDFVRYPKLHDRLLKMSDDEIRTPGDQLMYLLRNTLQSMEDAV